MQIYCVFRLLTFAYPLAVMSVTPDMAPEMVREEARYNCPDGDNLAIGVYVEPSGEYIHPKPAESALLPRMTPERLCVSYQLKSMAASSLYP